MNRSFKLLGALFLFSFCTIVCTEKEILVPGETNLEIIEKEPSEEIPIKIEGFTSTETSIQFELELPDVESINFHIRLGNEYIIYNQTSSKVEIVDLKPDRSYEFLIEIYKGSFNEAVLLGDTTVTLKTISSFHRFDHIFHSRDNYMESGLVQTADGGFLFTSRRNYYTPTKLYQVMYIRAIKTDADGRELWSSEARFNGEFSSLVDNIILTLPNGGYLIIGPNYFFQIDASGREVYKKQLPFEDLYPQISGASLTKDGHLIVVGNDLAELDFVEITPFLAKYDLKGNRLKEISLSALGDTHYEIHDVLENANGDYMIYGTYRVDPTTGVAPAFCAVISPDGEVRWNKDVSVMSTYDFPKGIKQATDGNYFLYGYYTIHNVGGYNSYVQKITPNGDILYASSVEALFSSSIDETNDGGVIMAGIYNGASRIQFAGLAKIDVKGGTEWYRQFTEPYGRTQARYAAATADGGYVVLGNALGNPWFFKTDPKGLPLF